MKTPSAPPIIIEATTVPVGDVYVAIDVEIAPTRCNQSWIRFKNNLLNCSSQFLDCLNSIVICLKYFTFCSCCIPFYNCFCVPIYNYIRYPCSCFSGRQGKVRFAFFLFVILPLISFILSIILYTIAIEHDIKYETNSNGGSVCVGSIKYCDMAGISFFFMACFGFYLTFICFVFSISFLERR